MAESRVLIRKAYYLCSCSREFVVDDIPKTCPCHMNANDGLPLTRIETFTALRGVENDVPIYPEAGVGIGQRDSGMVGWSSYLK